MGPLLMRHPGWGAPFDTAHTDPHRARAWLARSPLPLVRKHRLAPAGQRCGPRGAHHCSGHPCEAQKNYGPVLSFLRGHQTLVSSPPPAAAAAAMALSRVAAQGGGIQGHMNPHAGVKGAQDRSRECPGILAALQRSGFQPSSPAGS